MRVSWQERARIPTVPVTRPEARKKVRALRGAGEIALGPSMVGYSASSSLRNRPPFAHCANCAVAGLHRRPAPSRLTLCPGSRVELTGSTPKGCHHGGGSIGKGSTDQHLQQPGSEFQIEAILDNTTVIGCPLQGQTPFKTLEREITS